MVFRIVLVDASKEVVEIGIISNHLETVVARIAEGCTNHLTTVLLAFAVEREHYFGVVGMGIAGTVLIDNDFLSWGKWFLDETSLVGP